ncbi:MAG: hypothetical protein ACPGWM_02835 [Flavobacteriales bacterium]
MLSFGLYAQSDSLSADSSIYVSGKISDVIGRGIPDLMVINRTTGRGVFGEGDGSYLIKLNHDDVLQFGGLGYQSQIISFKDSTYNKQYTFNGTLKRLQVNLPEAQVIAPRELREIIADIEELGYDEKDYKVSGVNAFESPITFLYETFSKREQSKRKSIELFNTDDRRELLKELFVKYVEYDIIQLDDDEFDSFIAFMDPGDEVLQYLSQYEFIMFTKDRYEAWKYRKQELSPGDDQFHLDD